MQFSEGERVKLVTAGQGKSCQNAIYVRPAEDDTHIVNLHGQEIRVGGNLCRFHEIEPDAVDNFAQAGLPSLLDTLKQAVADLKLEELVAPITVEDNIISLMHGTISIQAEIGERRSIGMISEYTTWGVSLWRSVPSTQWSPEDVDQIPVGDCPHDLGAVKIALETAFQVHLESYFDRQGEIRSYEESAALEEELKQLDADGDTK